MHRAHADARPPIARGEVWTELAAGEDTGPDRLGARERRQRWSGSRRRRAPRRASRCAPSCASARRSWAESVCPTGEGDGYVWTRKRVVPVECDVRIGERRIRVEARGIEDESCGYHPHHTVWDWSAGVGETHRRREPSAGTWSAASTTRRERSERAIWVDGEPSEPGAGALRGPRGDRARRRPARVLAPRPSAARRRSGPSSATPTGSRSAPSPARLPGGLELAEGFGVMEHHDAHW